MRNEILAALPLAERGFLTPLLTPIQMSTGQILHASGRSVSDIYFIEDGLVSALGGMPDRWIEVALIGREGMTGACTLLGAASSHRAVVRAPGSALRLPAAELADLLPQCPQFHARLLGFVASTMAQIEDTVYVTGRCTVHQRLARWLLMARDRLDCNDLSMTHEDLAMTLGVRRPSITMALHVFEGERAIRAKRGRIVIRDRDQLRAFAGPAYPEANPAPVAPTLDRPLGTTERGLSSRLHAIA